MPVEIYEIVALAARFWFLFLMVLIVWRSYRWYARERRQRKKRLRLLPDAGYIGEFVVMQGAGDLERGQVLSVPFEGTLGYVRSNDICIPAPGVAGRHLWFSYDSKQGLVLTPVGRNDFAVDQLTLAENPEGLCMAHGSRLYIGECELRLRMFAGYEVGMVMSPYGDEPTPDGRSAGSLSQEQLFQLFAQSSGFDPYMDVNYEGNGDILYDEVLEPEEELPVDEELVAAMAAQQAAEAQDVQQVEEPVVAAVPPQPMAETQAVKAAQAKSAAVSKPTTDPQPAPDQEELIFHPLLEDDDWDETDDSELTYNTAPKGENIFAAAYRANTVKAAAEQAKANARQKAGLPEQQPAQPQKAPSQAKPQTAHTTPKAAPVTAQPVQPQQPHSVRPQQPAHPGSAAKPAASAKPLLTRPASLTPPPKLGKPSKAAKPQTFAPMAEEEAWPTVPRPEGWRSEGLFDDLVDEDGTDASMPPKSAYVGQDDAAWAKRQVWDKYFGGGDAP